MHNQYKIRVILISSLTPDIRSAGSIILRRHLVDNPEIDLLQVALPRLAELGAEHRPDLLGGVTILQGNGLDDQQRPVPLVAVPYYAWANRKKGAMTVWVRESAAK